MKVSNKLTRTALFLVASWLGTTGAFGQGQPVQPPKQQPQQPAPTQAPADKSAPPQAAPLTLDSAPPPVNAEEEAAIKAFRDDNSGDVAKRDQMADQFLQKYPQSRYRPEIYAWQVKSYYSKGEVDKMEAVGDKQLELTPNDPQTLAIVGSTLPRAMNASTPEPQKRLAKSEQYCQKALDVLPTLTKPEYVTDEAFLKMKNQVSAMAYSGLGVVAFRRGKYPDAISNFEHSVKVDPQPDPVNYYLLGISDEKTSHFDDAVTAFNNCAAIPGGMQTTCKQNSDEAKKLGATQLSAPK
jgi:tetratricopeptide (TPR) repeat protein